ncbi:MAG: response regulator [Bacteriovoracaceae bacterium]|nr:response regulator [Bacteriovoracaceae bacterium]
MGYTILIADNYPPTLLFLKEMFEKEGFFIHNASNGKEAYEVILSHDIHLIITSDDMPIMNGIDLLKLLQKEGWEIPSIVITGGDVVDHRELRSLGVLSHIKKPFFNKEEILEVVYNTL